MDARQMIRSCLFVNDNPEDQRVFIHALSDVFPSTLCFMANNGREALEIMQEDELVPDYIFMELKIPGIDGLEFLRAVRKIDTQKEPVIIVHSIDPAPTKVMELKAMGASAIYSKPYDYWGTCNLLRVYFHHDNGRPNLN